MSLEDRRAALVAATEPLLEQYGRDVSTRQIAEAAGIAEGTVFRAFATKEELIDAALSRAFEPGDVVARIEEIAPDLPLRARLVLLVSILQQRFRATFELMQKVGLVGPPRHDSESAQAWRARQEMLFAAVIGSDGDQFRVPATEFAHTLRLLTFAGSHPLISDGHLLTPDEIVDTVLLGLQRKN